MNTSSTWHNQTIGTAVEAKHPIWSNIGKAIAADFEQTRNDLLKAGAVINQSTPIQLGIIMMLAVAGVIAQVLYVSAMH